MQLKAGEIAKTLGIDETKFKATRGWCDRFMHRAGLSLRRQTSFCPELPADIKPQAVLECCFKRCCIAGALDAKGAVVWKNADTDGCDLSDAEELDSDYEVIVIT